MYKQFYSSNNVSDIKITSPALGGGNACYIIPLGATNSDFDEIEVISKIRNLINYTHFMPQLAETPINSLTHARV